LHPVDRLQRRDTSIQHSVHQQHPLLSCIASRHSYPTWHPLRQTIFPPSPILELI
jgi:hypothetical protein